MASDAADRLIGRLREQAREVYRLLSGLPEQQLAYRLEAGQWSLKELLCHLWRTQQVFEGRIQLMLKENNPEIEVYEPDGDEQFERMAARSSAELLAGFLSERQSFLKRLEALETASWERPGRHPEFPYYDVRFQLEYMAHHEAHHIYQMFQRRAALAPAPG
jgi:uncharacterized protein (TIGR03083 family)